MKRLTSQLDARFALKATSMSAITFATLAFIGCQNSSKLTNLSEVVEATSSNTGIQFNFCTDPATQQKQYLKTIIILDHSGSNQLNYKMASDGSGSPAVVNGQLDVSTTYATDPTGQTRYGTVASPGTLLNYLSNLPANSATDPTRFFALIDFNSTATTYPANASGFTSNISDFYTYVLSDSQASGSKPIDGGSTSYISALSKAYSIIAADITQSQSCAALATGSSSPGSWCPVPGQANASSYVIVFMSDGSPILSIGGIAQSGNQTVVTGTVTVNKESSTDILGEVGAINALASNAKYVSSINLFTIYYYYPGNVDLSGQSLLANMAKAGNGIAYNALSGSNINYSAFQPPSKLIKYQLGDVFVTNSSVAWWNDGKLHADTDMDGLPDDVEKAWGSNPLSAQSDKNGVSDLVKYQLSNAKACTTIGTNGLCTDAVTNYASGVCSSISNSTAAGLLTFQNSDPDGLNDCEKLLLSDKSGIGMSDSNGDLIPDWLEFKNNLPFQVGTTSANQSTTQDGYTQYQKIKLSLPMNVSATELLQYTPATYNLTQVSTSTTQDCYSLNVTNLPVLGDSNTVRIDVVETSPLLPDHPLFRVGKKKFASGSQTIQFSDWNNAAEKTAGTWSVTQ